MTVTEKAFELSFTSEEFVDVFAVNELHAFGICGPERLCNHLRHANCGYKYHLIGVSESNLETAVRVVEGLGFRVTGKSEM
jgi:hypothetical protein